MKIIERAEFYINTYGFNILPLKNKVPAGDWIRWQKDLMNAADLNTFSWKNVNGLGAVCGINNLRCFDFDKVKDITIVRQFVKSLGLPSEYNWVVQSGSGSGYHIWFYCEGDSYLFKLLGGERSYYKLEPKVICEGSQQSSESLHAQAKGKDHKPCDHIELRWCNCQTVLPPSLHPSGGRYKFLYLNDFPAAPPAHVPDGRLIQTLKAFCEIAETKSTQPVEALSDTLLSSAADFLSGCVNNYDDWLRIGFALASLGEAGRPYFLKISLNNPAYNDTEEVLNKKFNSLLKDYRGDIKIGSLYEIAKKYGFEPPSGFFWRVYDNKARIETNLLIEHLQGEGYAKLMISRDYILIKDTENIISEVTKVNVKDHIIGFINKNSYGTHRSRVLEHFIRNANLYCGESTLECLQTVEPVFAMDTKTKVNFYFKNCFLEVTKDSIAEKEYSQVSGKIWEKQKSPREYHYHRGRSEFQMFIENICRLDVARINALRSAIGYLLLSYKDPSCARAVIFTDEKLSEDAYGRSGKGLVAKAISQMKNVLHIDGKNFNFDKSFLFQSVDPDTQLLIFDDVRKKFSFDKLFSILTEGITVEKKNRNEYRVPYDRSPKILITTNHTIEGTDDSSLDRQFVVEFSDYYNARHKPVDEFGHLFFDEWDEKQWSRFYYFMAECCRYYLKNGLKPYKHVNLNKKKLIDSTAAEFEEFISAIPLNKEINKKELFEQFQKRV